MLMDALASVATPRVLMFTPQELTNLVWGFASARRPAPALFDAVAEAALVTLDEFEPQHLANMAWAYATAGHPAPFLLDEIAERGAMLCDRSRRDMYAKRPDQAPFSTQHLANMAWAYATAGHAAPQLFRVIAKSVNARAGDFKPEELARLAWAYATAGHRSPLLYEALIETAKVRGVKNFKPEEIADTAWAFAYSGYSTRAFFDALASVGVANANSFTARSVANTLWAFAIAGQKAPALFQALAPVAERETRLSMLEPAELANVAYAYAATGTRAPALFDAIADAAVARAPDFGAQQISILLWAFATAGRAPPHLFRTFAHVAVWIARDDKCEFTSRALADMAWAFAVVGHRSAILFDALAIAAVARNGALGGESRFTSAELARLAWAFAAADHPSSRLFGPAFAAHCEQIDVWFESELALLHEWQLWHAERSMPTPLSPTLARRCATAFLEGSRETNPSAGYRHVVSALESLNATFTERVLAPSGHLVDVQLTWRGEQLGLIITASDHFVSVGNATATQALAPRSTSDGDARTGGFFGGRWQGRTVHEAPPLPLPVPEAAALARAGGSTDSSVLAVPFLSLGGRAAMRQRQLASLHGLRVVTVPFWEWRRLLPGNPYSKVTGGPIALEAFARQLELALDSASEAEEGDGSVWPLDLTLETRGVAKLNKMPAGLAAWGCDEPLWDKVQNKKGLVDLLNKGDEERGRARIAKLRQLAPDLPQTARVVGGGVVKRVKDER